jgi:hypothetical protein
MKMRITMSVVALGVCSVMAHADSVLTRTFDLFNHPSGAIDPQLYGLRFDGFGDDTRVTFSFEDALGNSQVQLDVSDNMGQTEIRIHGILHGNSATGGTDYGTFMLDVLYQVDTEANGYDDNVTVDGGLIGSLTALNPTMDSPLAQGMAQDLFTLTDGRGSFRFLQDGHRISGDSSTWVGRGWLSPDGNRGYTNDFLFQAVESSITVVPIPGAAFAGFGMLGLMGAYRRIRK